MHCRNASSPSFVMVVVVVVVVVAAVSGDSTSCTARTTEGIIIGPLSVAKIIPTPAPEKKFAKIIPTPAPEKKSCWRGNVVDYTVTRP
jgi:hypothetical protein